MKEIFLKNVTKNLEQYKEVTKKLYENPEIGMQEYVSSKLLVDLIQTLGFTCTHPYICDTGFKGEYHAKKRGPTIAFLCEYDALPDVGHGCAHNLIGTTSIAAATALKEVIDSIGGSIILFGTPAEENFGGKIIFANQNAFDNVDLALMLHPGTSNGVGSRTNALMPIKFEFLGKNAHGCRPYDGRSALDAAVSTYTGISMLRQFCLPHTYIHGVIKHGGEAANVIPAYASMEYYFRNPKMDYVKEVVERAIEIAEGSAMQAGVTLKHSVYECPYDDKKINYTLANKLKDIFNKNGVENVKDVIETAEGSSDIGIVSYLCPTLEGQIKIADAEVTGHSKEMAAATISDAGTKALIDGSISLAMLAAEFIQNENFRAKVKKEFN